MKRLTLLLLLAAFVLSCSKTHPPVIEFITAEPNSVYPGDTVVLNFEANTGGDHDLYMHFEWSAHEGVLYNPTDPAGSTYHWIAPKRPGSHYLSLTISDPDFSVKDSILVTVKDTLGIFTDSRDGHEYKWVKIGTQIWMAENLAYLPILNASQFGSNSNPFYYVYGYAGNVVTEAQITTQYITYGVLYNWEAAKIGCPSGWHLPTDEEWKILEKHLGMSRSDLDGTDYRISGAVGGQLKETGTSHWKSPNTESTNSTGFTALPGGFMAHNDGYTGFMDLGGAAYFWSATAYQQFGAWIRFLTSGSPVIDRHYLARSEGLSVRCVKDEN